MSSGYLLASLMLLVSSWPVATALAADADEALCRGSYPVLLMTEQECRLYVRQVRDLQQAGRVDALAALQQQHFAQLRERAAICPCMDPKPQAIAPQHLVMLDSDC